MWYTWQNILMGISNVPKVYYASHPKNTFYTGIMQFFIFYSVTPFPSSQYNLLPSLPMPCAIQSMLLWLCASNINFSKIFPEICCNNTKGSQHISQTIANDNNIEIKIMHWFIWFLTFFEYLLKLKFIVQNNYCAKKEKSETNFYISND